MDAYEAEGVELEKQVNALGWVLLDTEDHLSNGVKLYFQRDDAALGSPDTENPQTRFGTDRNEALRTFLTELQKRKTGA